MYCSHCGSQNEDGARFCCNCGAPIEQKQKEEAKQEYTYEPIDLTTTLREAEKDRRGASILGAGIPGVIFAFAATFLNFIGIILGIVGLAKASSFERDFGGLDGKSRVGKILSIIALAGGIFMTLFWIFYFVILFALLYEGTGAFDPSFYM